MEENKPKLEDAQPKNSSENEEALSPEDLGKVSGGLLFKPVTYTGDPCEGGQVTAIKP